MVATVLPGAQKPPLTEMYSDRMVSESDTIQEMNDDLKRSQ
jgi:hypothetical protein